MTPEDAYELLEAIAIISNTQDKLKRAKLLSDRKTANPKRPAINFVKCNIPVGAELVFTEDPTVKVIVQDERKVLYNNEITSLSNVAGQIKGVKAIQGSMYFTYNGVPIVNIAEQTQWKDF